MTSLRCQVGLNGLNFFVGAIQTGFGPFFTVYLTQQGWSQVDIGFALSVGTAAALIFQLPAGALVDAIHLKRIAIAIALLLIGLSALVRGRGADRSTGPGVAESCMPSPVACSTPAIAALTLKLCGHDAFSERLGINGRYASLGNAVAAAVLGGIAYYVSEGAVFIFTALLIVPALRDAAGVSPRRPLSWTTIRPRMHPARAKQSRAPPVAHLPRSDPARFRGLRRAVPFRQRRDAAAGAQ